MTAAPARKSPSRAASERSAALGSLRRMADADPYLDAAVEMMLIEWSSVLPDLDLGVRAIAARIARIDSRIKRATAAVLQRHSLLDNEFRLLAGLMRGGAPYRRSPSELMPRYVPVTSGGLTGVINRLERRGLVRRVAHPIDQRVVLVEATREGRGVARRAMAEFAGMERSLIGRLSADELAQGNEFLGKLLRSIEQAMPSEAQL
jgi:DNA-binding MarR family transcriptional regulator